MDEKKTQAKRNKGNSQSRASNRKGSRSPENGNRKSTWKSANAFINFMQDFRKKNPEVKNPHTFKLAGEKWRNMSVEEKQPYVDAANVVKRQNKKDESQKKRIITPASKKIVLSKASDPKKDEGTSHDPSEGSLSTISSSKTQKSVTGNSNENDDWW